MISEANALNPLIQLQLFLARGRNKYFNYIDDDGNETVIGHERILTAPKLKRILERHNVYCKKIRYFRVFPNRKIFNRLFKIEKLLGRKWLAPVLTHYNFVGQREK